MNSSWDDEKRSEVKMSLTVVGGSTSRFEPAERWGAADAHHQGTVRVQGPADRQGVHVVREQGLMGKCVTDAPVIQNLREEDES